MKFTVKGYRGGIEREVTWEDGVLSGHEPTIEAIKADAEARKDEPVGPIGGPYTLGAHLAAPLSAAILIGEAFDKIISAEGEVPEPPETPEGAVV